MLCYLQFVTFRYHPRLKLLSFRRFSCSGSLSLRDVGYMMGQFYSKMFIVRPVSAVRPYDRMLLGIAREGMWYLPLKLSVTEDGLSAETSLAINILLRNWHIIYRTSHHPQRISLQICIFFIFI